MVFSTTGFHIQKVKVYEIIEQCFFKLKTELSHWRNVLGTFVAFHKATTHAI